MWQFGNSGRPRQMPAAVPQSTYDQLLSLRGVTVTLLFLDLAVPDSPVRQLSGTLEEVSPTNLTISLASPLPLVLPKTRFGVEVMSGPGVLRFQTSAFRPLSDGAVRISLNLPRQLESVQRRKFTRALVSTPLSYRGISESGQLEPEEGFGQSIDLSAGGMCIVTQKPLQPKQLLLLSFHTMDGIPYRGITARVVRCQSEALRYVTALNFINLTSQVEGQLVQTVFRLQLKSLAKR